ncbi:MAG: hypothetical protein K6G18_09155, partial [Treponema sp.]|nr:hypothetical protein [Treponema sp.]
MKRLPVVSILIGLLFVLASCSGNGLAENGDDSAYGIYSPSGGGTSSSAGSSSGSSSGVLSFDDILNLSNSGETDVLVSLVRSSYGNTNAPTAGPGAASADSGGMDTVALPAADIGLPAGGTVTLEITGEGLHFSDESPAAVDGLVYFYVPRIAVGTAITVSIAVKDAEGGILCSGSKTQVVQAGGSQFSVSLSGGSPVPEPAPEPEPEPEPEP